MKRRVVVCDDEVEIGYRLYFPPRCRDGVRAEVAVSSIARRDFQRDADPLTFQPGG